MRLIEALHCNKLFYHYHYQMTQGKKRSLAYYLCRAGYTLQQLMRVFQYSHYKNALHVTDAFYLA